MAILFESHVCGRCGGSGSHSYNQRHGSMCYGCNGKGEALTKRGAEAQRYFRELMRRPVAELKIGDRVRYSGATMSGDVFSSVGTIIEMDLEPKKTGQSMRGGVWHDVYSVHYVTEGKGGGCRHAVFPDSTVEIVDEEARKAAIEKALAYQATLTKAGKPSKRSQQAHSMEEVNG